MSGINPAIVYFHGMPGSPAELDVFGAELSGHAALFTQDRGSDRPELDFPDYMDALYQQIEARFPAGPIRLIGFSLGARTALEMATRLGNRVSQIDLVSAAAPLVCGVALNEMAGGALFRLARDAPGLFGLVSAGQRLLVGIAPSTMARMIFASATGEDAHLALDPDFLARMKGLLRHSLGPASAGYRREMRAYVEPWEDIVPRVTAPVTLWHGEMDNWAPPIMAHWLDRHLPNSAALHMLPGKSHYSALRLFLSEAL